MDTPNSNECYSCNRGIGRDIGSSHDRPTLQLINVVGPDYATITLSFFRLHAHGQHVLINLQALRGRHMIGDFRCDQPGVVRNVML
jgi:hypothetical protein